MTDRVPCTSCGALILPATARSTGGLCIPCKGNYRKDIEESRRRLAEAKQQPPDPADKHWRWLVEQVHKSPEGIASLSSANQAFFAACLVEREVYNGGFEQYFSNSSANYYSQAIAGLMEMGATESLRLLIAAKELLFGSNPVLRSHSARNEFLQALGSKLKDLEPQLDAIDRLFCKDTDNFDECAKRFVEKRGLLEGF